jgi:subtilase family serine protease
LYYYYYFFDLGNILLKQRNLDQLNTLFWQVSNPQHANYGKFLTTSEINALIAPELTTVKSVLEWLMLAGIPAPSILPSPRHIEVVTTVAKASALFNTDFATYKSSKTGKTRTRIVGAAHIPTELTSHIDFVAGIAELIDDTRIAPKPDNRVSAAAAADKLITPPVLQQYYGIPTTAATSNTTQAIAAFTDYYSAGALAVCLSFLFHFSFFSLSFLSLFSLFSLSLSFLSLFSFFLFFSFSHLSHILFQTSLNLFFVFILYLIFYIINSS